MIERLSQLRIVLVGTGAVGSTVAHLLVQAGVDHVLLVDPDRLERRNHATSPFLRQAFDQQRSPGAVLSKASLLAAEAERLGATHWTAAPCEIGEVGWQALAAYDAIVCCTDSTLSRVETAYTARMLGKPMLEAGVVEDGGLRCRYAWFPPAPDAACYFCGLRDDRRAQVLAFAASAALGCAPLPESPTMTGAPAAVQHAADGVMRLVRMLAAEALPGEALTWRCTGTTAREGVEPWVDEPLQPARSETCPWHGPRLGEWLALPWETPLDKALPLGSAVLQVAWPLCTEARCTRCGGRVEPFQRLSFVRRRASCPQCGETGVLQPFRTVEALLPGDPLRALSPRQLGQPPQHLYLLRAPVCFSHDVQGTAHRGMDAS